MPNCPECSEEIDSLTVSSHEVRFFTFQVIGKDQEKYYGERQGEPVTEGNDEFYCPECDKKLFDNEKDAEAFLKGAAYIPIDNIHVVVGVFSGVIGEDIYAYRDARKADEKEKELRGEYGLPEVKEEREEDYRENEVRHFIIPLNSEEVSK